MIRPRSGWRPGSALRRCLSSRPAKQDQRKTGVGGRGVGGNVRRSLRPEEVQDALQPSKLPQEVTYLPDGTKVRWIPKNKKHVAVARQEIIPSYQDKYLWPANLPKVSGIEKPLLPKGVSETGVLPAAFRKQLMDVTPYHNPELTIRKPKVNDLLGVLKHEQDPETRLMAAEQLQFVRTKLSISEASMVLDTIMEEKGWKAGLNYLERMGENPAHKLTLRHFNMVLERCCNDKTSWLPKVLQVVEEMEGQGVLPNQRTVYLMLEAAAERGDATTAEKALQLAKARALDVGDRSIEHAAIAYANGGKLPDAWKMIENHFYNNEQHDPSELPTLPSVECLRRISAAHIKHDKYPAFLARMAELNEAQAQKNVCPVAAPRRYDMRSIYKEAVSDWTSAGKFTIAEALLEEMCRVKGVGADRAAFCQSITLATEHKRLDQAVKFYKMMRAHKMRMDHYEYSRLMTAAIKEKEYETVLTLFDDMWSDGIPVDNCVLSLVIRAFGSQGKWKEAVELWEALKAPNTFCLNAVIMAVRESQDTDLMFRLLRDGQRKGVWPDTVTYSTLINGLSWPCSLYLLDEMQYVDLQPTPRTVAGAILRVAEGGHWTMALDTMRRYHEPHPICYNAAMNACGQFGEWRTVLDLLNEMVDEGLEPSAVSYTSVMLACGKAREGPTDAARVVSKIIELFEREDPFAHVTERRPQRSAAADRAKAAAERLAAPARAVRKINGRSTAIVHALPAASSAAHGEASTPASISASSSAAANTDDDQLTSTSPAASPPVPIPLAPPPPHLKPDFLFCTSAITALGRLGLWEKAVHFLHEKIPRAGFKQTRYLYNLVLTACATAGAHKPAIALLRELKERIPREPPNDVSYGAVVNACSRADAVEDAMGVIREMRRERVALSLLNYKHMLHACRRKLYSAQALQLVEEMVSLDRIRPDDICWHLLRKACEANPQHLHDAQALEARVKGGKM